MTDQLVIAFDLVGTLLDLSSLDATFRSKFGSSRVRHEWFSEVQKLMFSITAAGGYEPFSDIAEAALNVIGERHEQKLSMMQRRRILQLLRELPAFPDAKPALGVLRSNGFRLVVLTNSAEKAAKQVIESAGLKELFDDVLSTEKVKRLKPAPEPYLMVVKECGVKPRKLLLVAAHSWDVRGAIRAGCRACFVRRPEQILDELTPKPDFVISDLHELADQLTRAKNAA